MTYYEDKVLQDREARLMGSCVALFVFACPLAFVLGFFIAYPLNLPFTAVFYSVWGGMELLSVLSFIGIIQERRARERNLHA
jgi:hypothetical protein